MESRCLRGDFRTVARTCRRTAPLGEERLDDAIFKRVESDDDKTPIRLERAFCSGKTARQFAKLVIDEDGQGLKRARRGVNRLVTRMHDAGDDLRQTARRGDGCLAARLND